MKRWLVVAIVGAMLAVPVASGATWERSGYDPGRTGAIPFEGPQTNDTAFQVELPGTPVGDPLLDGDEVLLTTDDLGYGEHLTDVALWRIDLATGDVERVLDVPNGTTPDRLTSEALVVQDLEEGELVALDLPSGEERWRERAVPDAPYEFRDYFDALAAGDRLYTGFWATGVSAGPIAYGTDEPAELYGVMAVDMETGETLWTWNRTLRNQQVRGQEIPDPTGGPDRNVQMSALAADDEGVYPYLRLDDQNRRQYEVRGLDAQTGESLWTRNDSETIKETSDAGSIIGATPVVTENRLFIRLDAFQALNPATGETLWTSPAGRTDQLDMQGATSMGARDDMFIGTSRETVYRFDQATKDLEWQKTETSEDRFYGAIPVVTDEARTYVPVVQTPGDFAGKGVEVRDVETGELVWTWKDVPEVGRTGGFTINAGAAFGPGVMVSGAKDGVVTVVGETEASLGEPDVPEEKYPGVGNETTIDASGAAPGAFGEATRYMVDWGDGTVSGWQTSPTFTHTYNESGEVEAQVYAGNDANQTSSTVVTMNVGEEAPTEPNWIAQRFEDENQDMTFGVLGLAVALGGGAVGVARRRRKKSLLQEELETLEEGFAETKDDPGECEAFLETRKARARSLMMDGALDEEQFGVIESRVEELGRKLRTSVLDDRFQFLPYGLVQSLKKMLADGKISSWERDAVETLLEDEETLSEAQREKVRHQLDRWLVEDAGGDPP